MAELRRAIREYVAARNQLYAKPFSWTKDAEAILSKVRRAKAKARKCSHFSVGALDARSTTSHPTEYG